ncbi:MAG: GNAT family N-acetyltransferase [Thermoleophilia bacterium]|nr:GNAT family N-acetyltransferase [Thermoleophilia bacterium]
MCQKGHCREKHPATGLRIRRLVHLEPDMLAALSDFGREALGDSALDQWMLPVIADCGYLFVGESGTEVFGAAEVILTTVDGELYLEGFYVRPRYQGRGYGTQMLDGVCSQLARDGYRRLLATVDPGNSAGRGLYGKAGFAEIRYLPNRYGFGRHRLELALDLSRKARS